MISEEDLNKISGYFNVDHTRKPDPKVLQQCVLFYILYFFLSTWPRESIFDGKRPVPNEC